MSRKKDPPSQRPSDSAPERPPLWETLAMAASFVLLWAWFINYRAAQNAKVDLASVWQGALLLALGVMLLITVRRVLRFKHALEQVKQQARRGPAPFPWMPPDKNSRN
jgi:membrane protein YdbS with pleckstrin-like domain